MKLRGKEQKDILQNFPFCVTVMVQGSLLFVTYTIIQGIMVVKC